MYFTYKKFLIILLISLNFHLFAVEKDVNFSINFPITDIYIIDDTDLKPYGISFTIRTAYIFDNNFLIGSEFEFSRIKSKDSIYISLNDSYNDIYIYIYISSYNINAIFGYSFKKDILEFQLLSIFGYSLYSFTSMHSIINSFKIAIEVELIYKKYEYFNFFIGYRVGYNAGKLKNKFDESFTNIVFIQPSIGIQLNF